MNHLRIHIERYEPVPGTVVLSDISCVINEKEKIAIVGWNGAGKTSFMKILSGEVSEYFGGKENTGSMVLGYLAQIHFDDESRIVRDELRLAFPEIVHAEAELARLEAELADGGDIQAYTDALDRFQMLGGYSYQGQIERVARGIGVFELLDKHLVETSGGERTKIALAKILLSKPDFLLLDEPTNFIDLKGVEWLEEYLADTWKGGYCIISHDRAFLDRACTRTFEIEAGKLTEYAGNYTAYVEDKSKELKRDWKLFEEQQLHIQSEKLLINRFRAGSRAGFAKSREKMLDRLDVHEKPIEKSLPKFTFLTGEESQERVIYFKEAFIGRTEPLFYIQELTMRKGERIGIVGENGVGKSTFLKTILGKVPLLDGLYTKGKWLEVAWYSQMHEELDRDLTVYENFQKRGLAYERQRIASMLAYYGGFHFSDVDRKASDFSGGQISKILFCLLGAKESNFLVLDEPTNHLDYDSREGLEQSISKYPGTVLFISHDRYFVNKIAEKMWIIENGDLTVSYGNYDDYKYKKEHGLGYDVALYDDSAEMALLLEAKLWKDEAKRIREKFSRKR